MLCKGLCRRNTEEPSLEPVEFDPTFHGPIHDRGCTDIICCAVFSAVVFGHILLGFIAWKNGSPEHILYAKNSTGDFCGLGENADKPSVYYYNFMRCSVPVDAYKTAIDGFQCPTTQVCVKECPKKVWIFKLAKLMNTGEMSASRDIPLLNYEEVVEGSQVPCKPGFDIKTSITFDPTNPSKTIADYVREENCPFFHMNTRSVMGRCLPEIFSSKDLGDEWGKLVSLDQSFDSVDQKVSQGKGNMTAGFDRRSFGTKIFEDFAASWPWIILGLFTAMIVSLGFLLLLRYTAPIMVWSVIIGTILGMAITAYFCYTQYLYYKAQGASIVDKGISTAFTDYTAYLKVPETWLAFFIILVMLDVILLVMVIFLRERLRIAVAIIQESSKAIGYMIYTLGYPVLTFVLVLLCVGFWGVVSLYLVTLGDLDYKVVPVNGTEGICSKFKHDDEFNVTCEPKNFVPDDDCPTARCILLDYKAGFVRDNIVWVHAFNLFATLWTVNFVIALGQCTLGGAFASYYWAFCKPGDIPTWPLMAAFTRTLRYHVGSLAFGSLIITILQVIRMILEYIDHKTKDAQNPAVKFFAKCLKCLFWCLEKFLKFLNRNAYIMIAVYGKNFCLSAKNAFFLLLRNVVRVVVLDKVTDMLIFFGKLMVVGSVGALFYCLFSGRLSPVIPFDAMQLHYYWMPIITVAVGAYVIASGFFSVYSMCVDTLFLCFLEDLERNDGSQQKPYYMSSNLMNILDISNKPRTKGK